MSELYNDILSRRGSIENLMARLPAFEGYQQRQARRQADRIVRDFIAEQLTLSINRLASIEKDVLNNGGLVLMSKTADAKNRIQMFHDRVKAATPGYSGFFEAIQIDTPELEKLYSFDEAQIRYVDTFKEQLDALQQAATQNAGIEEAVEALSNSAREAIEAFSLREEVLTNLDKNL